MSGWLDGIERVANPNNTGGTFVASPWRFVVHTTEGNPATLEGCRSTAASSPYPPHFWYSDRFDWIGQTVPIDRSAYALEHPPGTPETNRVHAIQVEVFGYAADSPDWPASFHEGIAHLVRRVMNTGIPLRLDHVAETTGPEGYGTNGKVRFTEDQWADFDGLCGHANVPHNQHWDPGDLNLYQIAELANPKPAPKPKDPDMTPAVAQDQNSNPNAFVIGVDSQCWANMWDASKGLWSGWHPFGGSFIGGLSASGDGKGRIDVTGVGTDREVYLNTRLPDGSWTGWYTIGGEAKTVVP